MAHVEDRWHRAVDGARLRTDLYGHGRRWRVRWRDPAGEDRNKSFTHKADAERFAAEVEVRISSATYIDPSRGKVTVGSMAEQWLSVKRATRKRKTVASYQEVYHTLVEPTWAHVPVARVEYAAVQGWLAQLGARGLSASRVRHAHFVLRSVLDLAVRDRRIGANAAAGVEVPRLAMRRRHVYLTHGQLAALADAAGEYRPLVLLLGYAGLRWGEAIALRVRDVDQLRRRVMVERTIAEAEGRLWEDVPKTHRSRWVPVADPAWGALLQACEGRGADELVFTAPHGGLLRSSNFRRNTFDPAVKAAGLSKITPHDLRHTAASLAVAAGASVLGVQKMLGHARASMTLDVYADLFETDLDEVARRLSEAAAAAPAWTPPRSIGG